MKILNPVLDPPIFSLKQRRMFEALINDYSIISLKDQKMQIKVRENLKKQYKVDSTYNLNQIQFNQIIQSLLKVIQISNPTYNLKLNN